MAAWHFNCSWLGREMLPHLATFVELKTPCAARKQELLVSMGHTRSVTLLLAALLLAVDFSSVAGLGGVDWAAWEDRQQHGGGQPAESAVWEGWHRSQTTEARGGGRGRQALAHRKHLWDTAIGESQLTKPDACQLRKACCLTPT